MTYNAHMLRFSKAAGLLLATAALTMTQPSRAAEEAPAGRQAALHNTATRLYVPQGHHMHPIRFAAPDEGMVSRARTILNALPEVAELGPELLLQLDGDTLIVRGAEAVFSAMNELDREFLLESLFAAAPDDVELRSVRLLGEPERAVSLLPPQQQLRSFVERPPGALSGRRIALSPGHGYYWTGSYWTTQRGESFGLIEDFTTHIICRHHIDPYLRGAGAEVLWLREQSTSSAPAVRVDAGADYEELGAFVEGAGIGGWDDNYRYSDSGGTATWTGAGIEGRVPVRAWFVPGANRPAEVEATVRHDGGESRAVYSQRRGGPHWFTIGDFPFSGSAEVSLQAVGEGAMIADAVQFGTSTGGVVRDGTTAPGPGWTECARNYAEFSGAPVSVYTNSASENGSDVTARPLWANLLDPDAYISIHTNAGGGTGTSSFIYNGTPTAGSAELQDAVHETMVSEIRSYWNGDWTDRGQKTANFGELRELAQAPGTLIEVAFHDRDPSTGPDVDALKDPRFRRVAGRAVARGVIRYFDPNAEFVPEPPLAVTLTNTNGSLVAEWEPSDGREGSGDATSWRVYASVDGRNFDDGSVTDERLFEVPGVSAGQVVAVRVAGINSGGEGPASAAVAARHAGTQSATVLMVNGFDRWDRFIGEEGNTFDYLIEHGSALAQADPADDDWYAFDGATNEGVVESYVSLPDYHTALWQLGEESTEDETFSPFEQSLVSTFVAGGGSLIASGSEIAWDLAQRGDLDDRDFFADMFSAEYVADDAGTYTLANEADGPFGGLGAIRFSDGVDGVFDVDFPDVLGPSDGAEIALRYDSGGGAAVVTRRAAGGSVLFAFPLEAVLDDMQRGRLLVSALEFVGAPRVGGGTNNPDPNSDAGFADTDDDDTGDADATDTTGDAPGDAPGDAVHDVDRDPTDDASETGDGADSDTQPATTGPRAVYVNNACGCSASRRPQESGLLVLLIPAILRWRR